ncbi:cation/heavy metal transporter [Asaia krungthepensis NRIC 0535]|uniref:Cation/heavy metal transporter n=1 Tax=Asaia krungthepensis NRIC 0535 TaxID=1307925 RepID=A0ABQ0Q512_9PROT|nr:cation/heavy metal transporter [Asaia krungthepensis NRIC 0535]
MDLEITGMSCAACAARLEKQLNRQAGVSASVNFASSRAVITRGEGAPDLSSLEKLVEKTGFGIARADLILNISGMSCAACSARLEKLLNRLPGVSAAVNLASEQAHIQYIEGMTDPAGLMAAIDKAGFGATLPAESAASPDKPGQGRAYTDLLLTALFCLPFLVGMIAMAFGAHHLVPLWLQAVCATVVQLYSARVFYRSAWHALRSRSANMNVLVCLGTSIAYGFSLIVTFSGLRLPVYFEASAFVILLVSLGRLMEERARHKAAARLEALLTLKPETANRIEGDSIVSRPVATLRIGDLFLVRPGESIPVDGEVTEGETEIDESMLTGEASPVLRKTGDTIFAGTLNTTGVLRARATSLGSDTALARIVALVSRAQGSKAPIQRLADQVSAVFVPAIIAIALATFLIGWAVRGDASWALVSAISVLVIACPCSLGLATPTALMVGTGKAASAGILFRNAEALERLHRLDILALDKTGTITTGEPRIENIVPSASISRDALLATAAALEINSEHPLARAILRQARDENLGMDLALDHFRAVPGKGIEARSGRNIYRLGTRDYLTENGVDCDQVPKGEAGMTEILVSRGEHYLGVLSLSDALRPEAPSVMRSLAMQGIETIMLTGDTVSSARAVASRAGITQLEAALRPEGKVAAIEKLRGPGRVIGMAGDGINDAPALASADISIAIGSGSAAALETADLVLMSADLRAILDALSLSRATVSKIRQNLCFAFGYNIAAIPLAACGLLNPALAGGAMALSSVSVVSNSLLLNRWRSARTEH